MYVDLAEPKFWVVLALGWILLTPCTDESWKKRMFAGLSLGFLVWLIGPASSVAVLLGLFLFSRLLPMVRSDASRAAALVLLSAAALGLFLIGKLPAITTTLTVPHLRNVVTAIGFSYVFLRIINLVRWVVDEPDQPCPGLLDVICYLVPFHMLAAGPIQGYADYRTAFEVRDLSTEDALWGLERISLGLFKKFVLARLLSAVFFTDFTHPSPAYLFFEMQCNYVWLYLDFSGYSDIAVGAGRLMGYRTPENFDRPLIAPNLIDFWERWHITLSRFIKLNIFLPLQFWAARRLQGRRPLATGSVSFLISFLLCGLWHNVSWRFFWWGLLHGVGLAVCKLYQVWSQRRFGKKRLRSYRFLKPISVFLTFEFIAFSWLVVSVPEGTLPRLANLLW